MDNRYRFKSCGNEHPKRKRRSARDHCSGEGEVRHLVVDQQKTGAVSHKRARSL
jgi:hypothetical protein